MSAKDEAKDPVPKSTESNGFSDLLLQVQQDPQLQKFCIAVGVGFLVALILIVVLSKRRILSVARRAILILGPSDAGKTALFGQLVHGRFVDTYTSMAENSATKSFSKDDGTNSSKTVQLVDLPGHERLRVAGLEKTKSSARGILYVVDASNVAKTIADSTEYLFKILSDPVFYKNSVPVMVVCNKSDLDLAKSARLIERELEKEINLLRDTHSRNILASTDGATVAEHFFQGNDFKFSQLPNKIDFCEVSAKSGDEDSNSGLEELRRWIYSVA